MAAKMLAAGGLGRGAKTELPFACGCGVGEADVKLKPGVAAAEFPKMEGGAADPGTLPAWAEAALALAIDLNGDFALTPLAALITRPAIGLGSGTGAEDGAPELLPNWKGLLLPVLAGASDGAVEAPKLNMPVLGADGAAGAALGADAKGLLKGVPLFPAANVKEEPPVAPPPKTGAADGAEPKGFDGGAVVGPPKLKSDEPAGWVLAAPNGFLAGDGSSSFMGLPSNWRLLEPEGVDGAPPNSIEPGWAPNSGLGASVAGAAERPPNSGLAGAKDAGWELPNSGLAGSVVVAAGCEAPKLKMGGAAAGLTGSAG